MDPDWKRRAACRRYPHPEHFFDMSADPAGIEIVLNSLCTEHCPVLRECRDFIDREESAQPKTRHHGYWAGETVKQRQARRSGTEGSGASASFQQPAA